MINRKVDAERSFSSRFEPRESQVGSRVVIKFLRMTTMLPVLLVLASCGGTARICEQFGGLRVDSSIPSAAVYLEVSGDDLEQFVARSRVVYEGAKVQFELSEVSTNSSVCSLSRICTKIFYEDIGSGYLEDLGGSKGLRVITPISSELCNDLAAELESVMIGNQNFKARSCELNSDHEVLAEFGTFSNSTGLFRDELSEPYTAWALVDLTKQKVVVRYLGFGQSHGNLLERIFGNLMGVPNTDTSSACTFSQAFLSDQEVHPATASLLRLGFDPSISYNIGVFRESTLDE